MITLHSEELIALNSIIDNEPIYGIHLIEVAQPEEERVQNVIISLREKKLMIENTLSDKGHAVTRLLHDYKQCSTYVFLNQLRIALLDETHAIVIEKTQDNDYTIARTQKVIIEKKLIVSAPYLQQATKQRFLTYTKEEVKQEAIEKELENAKWSEILLLQKHVEHTLEEHILLYMSEVEGYRYDYQAHEKVQVSPKDMRMELMNLLEIRGDEYGG